MTAQAQEKPLSQSDSDAELWPYERVLAHSIKDVVAEICLTDASIVIGYILGNLHANIDDLVTSSTELYFKEGALSYGYAAEVSFEWGKAPAVVLDMEFVNSSVTVFFKLVLHGYYVGVAIQRILLGEKSEDVDVNVRRLQDALADSRLTTLPSVPDL
jgi:hypothetical protein